MTDFSLKINPGVIMKSVESDFVKADLPRFEVGDTVKLSIEIKEGAKERLQYYEGVIISIKNSGISKTITVRRVLQNIGVERVFLINSPKIKAIEIR